MKLALIWVMAVIFFVNTSLKGQQAVVNSHYFKDGVSVTYQPVLDSLIIYQDTGENKVWDYSNLVPKSASYNRTIERSTNTVHGESYPESNYAIVGQDGDHVYLNVEKSKTEFIAFIPPDDSFRIHNYQPWSISIHPMRYGDTISAPIARKISAGERTVFRNGKMKTIAIGYGTLILPNKTYENVLKIKEIQIFRNPSKTTFYKAVTYHWLSNATNFPLLSCNEIIDRNSEGDEQRTRFAQYLVEEENTNENLDMKKTEEDRIQHIK